MNLSDLLIMLIPSAVALLGGAIAIFYRPSDVALRLIQHFAAGVVLAVLAVELLPEIEHRDGPVEVLISAFLLGAFLMCYLKIWTGKLRRKAIKSGDSLAKINLGFLIALFSDVSTDGLVIGAGISINESVGYPLVFGLSVELLFIGLAINSEIIGKRNLILITALLSVVAFLSALAGNLLICESAPIVISAILSFSTAALLYLVTEELLESKHNASECPVSTLFMFCGFLFFWGTRIYFA